MRSPCWWALGTVNELRPERLGVTSLTVSKGPSPRLEVVRRKGVDSWGWVDHNLDPHNVKWKKTLHYDVTIDQLNVKGEVAHLKEMTTRQMTDGSHCRRKVMITDETIIRQERKWKASPSFINRWKRHKRGDSFSNSTFPLQIKKTLFFQKREHIALRPVLPKDRNKIDLSCAHNIGSQILSTLYLLSTIL